MTARRKQVLDALLTSKSNKEIAADLSITLTTLKQHYMEIYRYFGVQSRYQLMSMYIGNPPICRDKIISKAGVGV